MNYSSTEPPRPSIPMLIHRIYLYTGGCGAILNAISFYVLIAGSIKREDTLVAIITQAVMTLLSIWVCFVYEIYMDDKIYSNNTYFDLPILRAIYMALFCSVGVCLAAQLFIRQQNISPFGSFGKLPRNLSYLLIGMHYIFFTVGTVIIYLWWSYSFRNDYPSFMDYYVMFITATGTIYFGLFYWAMRQHVNILKQDKTNTSLLNTHARAMLALNGQIINLLICFGLPMFIDKYRLLCVARYTVFDKVLFYITFIVPANICIPNSIVMISMTKRYKEAIVDFFRRIAQSTIGNSVAISSTAGTSEMFQRRIPTPP